MSHGFIDPPLQVVERCGRWHVVNHEGVTIAVRYFEDVANILASGINEELSYHTDANYEQELLVQLAERESLLQQGDVCIPALG